MQSILMLIWFILVAEPVPCNLRAIEWTSSTHYGSHNTPDKRPEGYTSGFL